MKEEVERIKKLVGIDHNRWEQPCSCDKCKNMCKIPCIGTPKDIEAIIDAGYADRLKETMWMVGYLAVKEKPIAMIQPTEKDGWCVFRQPDGLCELHDRGLKPTEGGMDWLFGSLGNENFYICQPLSFYKSQREIEKVNPLYAFKLATAYFRGQGMVPVFEDSNCRLIKL